MGPEQVVAKIDEVLTGAPIAIERAEQFRKWVAKCCFTRVNHFLQITILWLPGAKECLNMPGVRGPEEARTGCSVQLDLHTLLSVHKRLNFGGAAERLKPRH